ncbi:crustacean cardioactive peptide receptor [Arctopsyche grandis]|uniref:crustacean cardioactive peptide receptor n=1 Tax=Arctopsyche grandis TaxID=121162 RepID=UPI00406D886E
MISPENLVEAFAESPPTPRALLSSTVATRGGGGEAFDGNMSALNHSWTTEQNEALNATNAAIDNFFFYETVQFTVMWILFVAIVAGNGTVIAALLLAKSRKSRMNYFIMQLAIADLCVGLISVLTDIVQKMMVPWVIGNIACKIVKFLQVVVTYSSTYVLVALSIDRCDAITNPMNFSGSWKRAKFLIASAWILSIVFSVPILVLYEEKVIQGQAQCWIELGTPQHWQIWMTCVSLTLFVFPALTITACYTVIVLTIWAKSEVVISPPSSSRKFKRNKQIPPDADSRRASSRGLIPRAKIKTVKMTFVIVFVFILCWSPYMIFDLLQVFGCIPNTQTNAAVATLIQSLAPLNSAANPLIYCLFSTHIFKSLRKIPPFKWLCCWSGRSGNSRGHSESTTLSEMLTSSDRHRRATLLQRDRHDSSKQAIINGTKHQVHKNTLHERKGSESSGKRVQLMLHNTTK